MRCFRVKYDFKAEEGSSEVSVQKDEMVSECESGSQFSKEWVLVQAYHDATRKGYVPISFLEELSSAIADEKTTTSFHSDPQPSRFGAQSLRPAASPVRSPVRTSPLKRTDLATPTMRGFSPKRGESFQLASMKMDRSALKPAAQTLAPTTIPGPVPVPTTAATGLGVGTFTSTDFIGTQVAPIVESDNKLQRLEEAISDVVTEVRAAQDQNGVLVERIIELETIIDEERRSWAALTAQPAM